MHPKIVAFVSMLVLLCPHLAQAQCPRGDVNQDCQVDLSDLRMLSAQWLAPPDSPADLNGDDKVDLGDFGLLAADWRARGLALFINEFQASNAETVQDPQAQYDDWIEIYNGSGEPLDIGGMYLTDDLAAPTRWQIPADAPAHTTIAPHGYLVIWADGQVADSGLHAGFSLDAGEEEIALFDRDGVTLIDMIEFADQETDISYGRLPDGSNTWQALASPTPGAENVAMYEGFVTEPEFSIEHGFYNEPIQVALTTETEGAEIYYTTNGDIPYEMGGRFRNGKIYTQPITIAETTCLRARAVRTGWRPSGTRTSTYLFIDDVIRQSPNGQRPDSQWPSGEVNGQTIDYGMDPAVVEDPDYRDLIGDALLAIPSVSLVTDLANLFDKSKGIYSHPGSSGRSWERPVSVELLNPDGSEGFQIDAGLRIRGGFSRSTSNPKHAFRLFFRTEYGGALEYPLFGEEGVDRFENVDLRTSQNYSWSFQGDRQNTMVREVFSRDVQGQMGQPYTRSRYYHLYLNGHYWGLYQTQERSEASYAESYFGGDKDDYDVVKSESGSYSMANTDGNLEAYRRLYDAAMTRLSDDEDYYRGQGLNTDGTPNPAYERLLDVDNLIDLMIIDYYTGDRDGPGSRFTNRPNNIYGIYNRLNPDGWKWFQHDGEHSLGVSRSETNLVTPFTSAGSQWRYFNPHWLNEQIARHNKNYRMRFADRAYRHFFNGGVLTAEASIARINRRAEQIEMAIIAESARWGDAKRSTPYTKWHWEDEIGRMIANYLPTRTQVVLGQFRSVGWYPDIDPPTFSQHGGYVPRGFNVHLSATKGTIYYTTDGSDPRTTTGANVSRRADRYSGAIPLMQSMRIKTRALSGTTWSALNEATFAVGPVAESLRISEIMYHPIDTGHPDDPNAEYIELTNIGTETIDLNLVAFTNGVDFTFGPVELAPGDYVLVARDMVAFENRYGAGLPVAGQFAGRLDNAGERIELQDAAGQTIHNFRFRDGWYDLTDGQGFSLTVAEPARVDPNGLGDKDAWRPSAAVGGSPGYDDSQLGID
ncbi:MAG: lamin tail domain-containing protein [Phycisphaerales bacterium]|nr:MAG: lamin tail domain-containing protein [Phycisphaerales bacterium]